MAFLAVYGLYYARPCPEGFFSGLTLALAGEILRLWAIGYSGEPTRSESLDAPRLITAGPYAYVRNPLYVGNILNSAGVLMAAFYPWDITRIWMILPPVIGLYVYLVSLEEKFLAEQFGAQYRDYQRQVPAWLPNGQTCVRPQGRFDLTNGLRHERTSLIWWIMVWALLAVKGWM